KKKEEEEDKKKEEPKKTFKLLAEGILGKAKKLTRDDLLDRLPELARVPNRNDVNRNKVFAAQFDDICSIVNMATKEFAKGPRVLELDPARAKV
ncbi:hypothetical protein PMAYCL1PPCAC_26291, partial [Pristionchus mayeri]